MLNNIEESKKSGGECHFVVYKRLVVSSSHSILYSLSLITLLQKISLYFLINIIKVISYNIRKYSSVSNLTNTIFLLKSQIYQNERIRCQHKPVNDNQYEQNK